MISRILQALRIIRETRRVEGEYLTADTAEGCLAAVALIGDEVADRLARRHRVEPGYTPYVTAARLVAARFPSSWVAREVREDERRHRALLGELNLITALRV